MTDSIVAGYWIDRLGYTETQAYKALYQGGLTIESTQDPDIQNICDEEVNNLENYPTDPKVSFSYRVSIQSPDGTISNYSQQTMLSYYQKSNKNYSINFASEDDARAAIEQYKMDLMQDGDVVVDGSETLTFTVQPQAALTVMDQSTGEVKALVGGRGDKTANKTLNRATDTTRQPGSTFKIIAPMHLHWTREVSHLPMSRMMRRTITVPDRAERSITTTSATAVSPHCAKVSLIPSTS